MKNKDILIMSKKDINKIVMIKAIINKDISITQAAKRLHLSYRHVLRLKKQYIQNKEKGIIHKSRGKPSHNQHTPEFKETILSLYTQHFKDYGPTFASEKLHEHHNIHISKETLRLWLMTQGLWKQKKKKSSYRARRERKTQFGELIQIDGSHHRWFGPQYAPCCLMNFIDDATGISLLYFAEQETFKAVCSIFQQWLLLYGIPQALYCDKKNTYIKPQTIDDTITGKQSLSSFGLICKQLGTTLISAHSPQAKGRVERSFRIHQDRLVKELALHNITSIEKANVFLQSYYIEKHNSRFAHNPHTLKNTHAPLLNTNLHDIFVVKHQRVVSNDFVIRYKNKLFQIIPHSTATKFLAKKSVSLHIHLNDSISLFYKDTKLSYNEITHSTSNQREVYFSD